MKEEYENQAMESENQNLQKTGTENKETQTTIEKEYRALSKEREKKFSEKVRKLFMKYETQESDGKRDYSLAMKRTNASKENFEEWNENRKSRIVKPKTQRQLIREEEMKVRETFLEELEQQNDKEHLRSVKKGEKKMPENKNQQEGVVPQDGKNKAMYVKTDNPLSEHMKEGDQHYEKLQEETSWNYSMEGQEREVQMKQVVQSLKSEKKGIFASTWKTLVLIFMIAALIVGLYPFFLQLTQGTEQEQIARYATGGYFQSYYMYSQVSNALIKRHIQRTIPDFTGNIEERKPFVAYYIADEDKSYVQTNMTDEQWKTKNSKDNYFYGYCRVGADGHVSLVHNFAEKGFEEYREDYLKNIIEDAMESLKDEDYIRQSVAEHYNFRVHFHNDQGIYLSSSGNAFDFKGNYNKEESTKEHETEDGSLIFQNDKQTVLKIINTLKDIREQTLQSEETLDIIVCIPKNALTMENIKSEREYYSYLVDRGGLFILVLAGFGIVLVFFLALFAPFRKQRKSTMVSCFNRMFLELKGLLLIFLFGIILLFGIFLTEYDLWMEGVGLDEVYKQDKLLYLIATGNNIYYFFFAMWIAFFGLLMVYLNTVYLKYIYYMGFMEGLFKNSVFGRMICFCLRPIGKLWKLFCRLFKDFSDLKYIDLSTRYKRNAILFVAGHCIALFVLDGLFGLSMQKFLIFLGLYGIWLFQTMYKILTRLAYVQSYTEKLSKGNFDIQADENIGIFSGITKNLNAIKEGFKIAVEKEVKSQNLKTELISNVSHDLKTPLTSIINYSDLLKQDNLSEEQKQDYIDIIYQKSQRLKVLIEDLFEASKASSGNITLHLEELDILALLRQTMGEMEERIQHSGLDFRLNVPDKKLLCNIDGRRTYRIFSNIISNITKYSMKGTRVYVDVSEEENSVEFQFKNIADYEMNFNVEEISERFKRGDTSRSTEGSGLGLAITKSLLELQKGEMKIEIDGDLFKLIAIFPKSK